MPNQAISELLRLVTYIYQITSLSNSEQSKHSKNHHVDTKRCMLPRYVFTNKLSGGWNSVIQRLFNYKK